MAKFAVYALMILGLLILFNLAGYQTPTGKLLDYAGLNITRSGENVTDIDVSNMNIYNVSTFLYALSAILLLIGVGAIALGYATKTNPLEYVIPSLVLTLIGYLSIETVALLNVIRVNSEYPIIFFASVTILAPILFFMWISAVSWWRGSDA
jgi:hypothetical protein